MFDNTKTMASFRKSGKLNNRGKKIPWYLTKAYRFIDYFLIIPFSRYLAIHYQFRLFNVWSLLFCLSLGYNLVYVPYSIATEVDAEGGWMAADIISLIIFFMDTLLRVRLALTADQIEIDLKSIQNFYFDKRFFMDLLVLIPVDYVLLPFEVTQ